VIALREAAISFNDSSAIVAALNSLNILWNQPLRFNGLSAGRQTESAADALADLIALDREFPRPARKVPLEMI
jgi:hypothetical protein